MPPFWTPLRAPFWTPRQAETGLLGGLGPSKSRFQLVFFGPGGVQERSKRPTGGENKGPRKRTIAKRPPRGFQDQFGSQLGRILEPSGDDLDNFGTSWGVVVCILFSLKQVAENIKGTGNKHICGVVSGPVSEPRRPCERLFHERAFRSLAKTGLTTT